MEVRQPIRIVNQNGQFKVSASLETFSYKKRKVLDDLKLIEVDYKATIMFIRELLKFEEKHKKPRKDPRTFWIIGNSIDSFIKRLESLGYYLVDQYKTFGVCIGVSYSSLKKIVYFYRRIPDINLIDPSISWQKYRENKL